MIIIPAIDLRDGKVVRLLQGKAEDQTVYSDDPASTAIRWEHAGAQWLHLVDLDGAFDGAAGNLSAVRSILGAISIPCELGGGVRSIDQAAKLLSLGIERVVFGTVAITDPDIVARAVERFGPEHIVVGIDARDGKVAVRGWTETSGIDALELARNMRTIGVTRIVYTDISRDGMQTGPNIEATVRLARETGVSVIASGGVSSADDIRQLARHSSDGIEGVITGKALYDGRMTLEEAIEAASESGYEGEVNT